VFTLRNVSNTYLDIFNSQLLIVDLFVHLIRFTIKNTGLLRNDLTEWILRVIEIRVKVKSKIAKKKIDFNEKQFVNIIL
jgi:hypothetical protein